VLAWRTPYGYRRRPRDAHGPAGLEVFEPNADPMTAVVWRGAG
jgi:hypothetical protein